MDAPEIRALAVNFFGRSIFFAVTKRQESRASGAYLPPVRLDERVLPCSCRAAGASCSLRLSFHHIWCGTKRDCGCSPDSAPVRSGFDPNVNAIVKIGKNRVVSGYCFGISPVPGSIVPKQGGQCQKRKDRRDSGRSQRGGKVKAAFFLRFELFTPCQQSAPIGRN